MTDYLDDFFAKKDKKRGKNKNAAVLSSEALVRELEEGSKQVEYSSRKDNKTSAAIEILGLDADDADWRDFDDVEKRDYSGLKVKEMSLQDQNEGEQRRPSSDQVDPSSDTSAWKVKDETTSTSAESTQDKATDSAKSDIDPTVPSKKGDSTAEETGEDPEKNGEEKTGDKTSAKKYIPPQLRQAEVKKLEPTRLGKAKSSSNQGHVPNIQDKQMFPELG